MNPRQTSPLLSLSGKSRCVGMNIHAKEFDRDALDVRPCQLGWGVFTTRQFSADETILWFSGRIIDFDEIKSRDPSVAGHPLQVDLNRYIDVESPGMFVNHSCEPNAGLRDSHRLIALREILVGEQICYDYSTEMFEGLWTMDCKCGSAKCRGLIVDFDLLSSSLQQERLRQEIVQSYIIRELSLDNVSYEL